MVVGVMRHSAAPIHGDLREQTERLRQEEWRRHSRCEWRSLLRNFSVVSLTRNTYIATVLIHTKLASRQRRSG